MSHKFDVFLSHNSKDKPVIREIARLLREQGLHPWLDEEQLVGGERWQVGLERVVGDSATCAMFIGPHNLGNWQEQELDLVRNRAAASREFRLIPVLLPGLTDPFDASLIPPLLQNRTWVDLRHGVDGPQAIDPLVRSIKGIPLGPRERESTTGVTPATGIVPYLGLDTFDEATAQLFFGRDADVQRLVEKLKASNFLAVIGASGSGKSSLVRAGLIPALRNNALPQSHEWVFLVLRPGSQPILELTLKLLRLGREDYGPADKSAMEQELRQKESGLYRGIILQMSRQGLSPEQERRRRVVVVVDQFEEIFTLCQDEAERRRFLENLLHASSAQDNRCLVILTMRADFYHKCAAYDSLAARMSSHQYLVGPMSDENLKEAIEGPARLVGTKVEPELLDRMIEEVRNQPGSLPLLEYALLEVWKQKTGNVMTLRDYDRSGGVKGALAKKAESIYEGLSPARREIVRRIMLRLTQPGQGTEDTRRRAALSEMTSRTDGLGEVEAVVSQFTNERLLTTGRDDREGIVDVSHEALIRGWPRLRGWVDEDRAGLLIQHRLTEASKEWVNANRDRELLYRGTRLQEALAWQKRGAPDLAPTEREFLQSSEQELHRLKRLRRIQVSLVALGVAVVLLALLAVRFEWYSNYKERLEARQEIELLEKNMVEIPAGEFLMGSESGGDEEKPVHKVKINAFRMSRFEITQKQWFVVMRTKRAVFEGDDRPIENVNWFDAKQFCEKLSMMSGKSYRLPTEAEWEYAARGGTTTEYSFGDDESQLGEYAWFSGNAGGQTHPGGQKKPNPFGLYDMHGNVWEWVEDHWYGNYTDAPTDGSAWLMVGDSGPRIYDMQGNVQEWFEDNWHGNHKGEPTAGSAWLTRSDSAFRVLRGGSWLSYSNLRSAVRDYFASDNRINDIGFRVVVGAQTQSGK